MSKPKGTQSYELLFIACGNSKGKGKYCVTLSIIILFKKIIRGYYFLSGRASLLGTGTDFGRALPFHTELWIGCLTMGGSRAHGGRSEVQETQPWSWVILP